MSLHGWFSHASLCPRPPYPHPHTSLFFRTAKDDTKLRRSRIQGHCDVRKHGGEFYLEFSKNGFLTYHHQ